MLIYVDKNGNEVDQNSPAVAYQVDPALKSGQRLLAQLRGESAAPGEVSTSNFPPGTISQAHAPANADEPAPAVVDGERTVKEVGTIGGPTPFGDKTVKEVGVIGGGTSTPTS